MKAPCRMEGGECENWMKSRKERYGVMGGLCYSRN